jgi:hypothetical protein
LQANYPIATNIVYLPDSFYLIAHFLWHKANDIMHYHNIIKKALIKYCTNFNEGFDVLATEHFPTQHSVVDWCVGVTINNYISETANLMLGQLKIKYWCSANDAKDIGHLGIICGCKKSNIYSAMISKLSLLGRGKQALKCSKTVFASLISSQKSAPLSFPQ